ncbi:hypothetical protein LguiB_022057 [Lonicera macranthoides]
MVTCNSCSQIQPHLLSSSLFKITIFHFFLTLIPHSTSLDFNFSDIYYNQGDITFGNNESYISSQGLQVTPNELGIDRTQRAGRATYKSPLHLWDNSSGELANFSTNFTFVIDSSGSTQYADGFAFSLAHNNSVITAGGAFGLPLDPVTVIATDPFVAVEFDTFWNGGWDPMNSTNSSDFDHVGIDINSLASVQFERWFSNITGGAVNEAWVNYDATSKNLSVVFTGFRNNQTVIQSGLSYTVDLRQVLPEWVIFGFSASTGRLFQKNTVRSWSFTSSTLKVDEDQSNGGRQRKKKNTGLVVGVAVGVSVLVGVLVLIGFAFKRRRERKKREDLGIDEFMDNEFEMGSGAKKFPYKELARATNHFAEDHKLGEGGFGGVYKGFLSDTGTYVAVKRVSSTSRQGIKEYASEVKIISRLRHRNLVQLIGWCHEKGELLLVYDFMENGSLDSHLFKEKSLLTWGKRFKIAQGIASALLYLHEEWEQCVVHRDIKSSNIMLDMSFNAKLGDFGLARLVDHEKEGQTTVVAGTMGYMASEYMETGRASKESDVFSFGVVALEIACGRKPIDFKAHKSRIKMVEWVWDLYGKGKLLDAADPKMDSVFDDLEMERLMIVGLWCAHPDLKFRPSIRQSIHVLNLEAPLPNLPSKMPVATYFAGPTSSFSSSYGVGSQVNSSSYSFNTDSSKLTTSSGVSSAAASVFHTTSAPSYASASVLYTTSAASSTSATLLYTK